MNFLKKIQSKFNALWSKDKLEREMDEEIRGHVERRTLANLRMGMGQDEARTAALREFGWAESIKETCREQRGVGWIENFLRDFRFSVRMLGKNPGFTAAAILTLAVGIGACTGMFSIVNAVLLKPLPFREPSRLVWIENVFGGGLSGRTSKADTLLGWRNQNKTFESMAGYFAFSDYTRLVMTGSGEPERITTVGVTDNFLPTLGVNPLLGRNFSAEECTFNGPQAVILSHGYWQRHFGGDGSIVGKSISLNEKPATVIGVLPKSFDFSSIFTPGNPVDVITPFPLAPETAAWGNTVFGIGRLKPGVSLEQAQSDLTVISDRLHDANKGYGPFGAQVSTLDKALRGQFRSAFLILAAAVGCVLAIACVNLSNLLLARMNARRQEFNVRIVLGANRLFLIQQALTESLLLAFAGSLIAVPLAWWATRLLARLQTFGVPLLQDASIDPTALGVAIGLTTLAGVMCGLLPAFHLSQADRSHLADATHQRSTGRSAAFARNSLVVVEVALACMLLVGATLLIRSFSAVLQVKLGFQPNHAMAWRIDTAKQFKSGNDVDVYFKGMAERIGLLPGVEAVGVSDTRPLGRNRSWGAGAVGVQYAPGQYPDAFPRLVDPHYLKAMKIPLIAGRYFDEQYNPKAENTVIINEKFARALWPGQPDHNPIGEKIAVNGQSTIIGVVANVRHSSLEEEGGYEMYLDSRQCSDWSTMEMVVRSSRTSESLAPEVRAALSAYDPDLPSGSFYKLDQLIDNAVGPRRLVTKLLSFFSAMALSLAVIGLYGVIAYSVAQRTQEIGIRMAVGACRSDILRLVLEGGI
jgi:predicted permease